MLSKHLEEMRRFESKAVGQELSEEEFVAHWRGTLAFTGAVLADDWDALVNALPAWVQRLIGRRD